MSVRRAFSGRGREQSDYSGLNKQGWFFSPTSSLAVAGVGSEITCTSLEVVTGLLRSSFLHGERKKAEGKEVVRLYWESSHLPGGPGSRHGPE